MSEEERNGLIKQRRLLREKCKQKDKEIDRLNNIIDKQDRDITALTKGKLELKNIINELEKVFIECDYQHLQRKLKSLKENNKDE